MTRKCSHCSHNGHNSRTCPNRGVKLFGVRLTEGGIRKSASMGNLTHYASGSGLGGLGGAGSGGGGGGGPSSPAADGTDAGGGPGAAADGYASEDFVHQGSSSSVRERKKGVPWTEEEHRMFLLGLQKLGKGDWRGIARNFVLSRTPTQVASHAQKYFIRQTNANRRKRRSSLFDIVADEAAEMETHQLMPTYEDAEPHENSPLPEQPTLDEECESMDSTNSVDAEVAAPKPEVVPACNYPMFLPAYFSPFFPFPIPYIPGYGMEAPERQHEIIKPTPVHSKTPIDVDQLVGMSKLSLGESKSQSESTPDLSLKLLGGADRQSAFHANPTASSSGVNSSSNPVPAI